MNTCNVHATLIFVYKNLANLSCKLIAAEGSMKKLVNFYFETSFQPTPTIVSKSVTFTKQILFVL